MELGRIETILLDRRKDILAAMTYAVKELGGHYEHRSTEEVFSLNELYFQAHMDHLFHGDPRPLLHFADVLARTRAEEHFQLHELLRTAFSFKKAVAPILIHQCWDNRHELVAALTLLDKSVDRFIVNLSQAYLHHAREFLELEPVQFPVWVPHELPESASQTAGS